MKQLKKEPEKEESLTKEIFVEKLSSLLGAKKETISFGVVRNSLSQKQFQTAISYFNILFPHPQITEGFTGATDDLLDKVFSAVKNHKPIDMYMAFGGRISGEVPLGILKYVYYTAQVSEEASKLFGRHPKTTILLTNSHYLSEIMGFPLEEAKKAESFQRHVLEKGLNRICTRIGVPNTAFQIVSYDELRNTPEGRRFVKEFLENKKITIGKSGFESLVNMAKKAKQVDRFEAERLAENYAKEQVVESSLIMHLFKPAFKIVEPSEEIFDVVERQNGLPEVTKRPSIVLRGQRKNATDIHIVGPAYHPHDNHPIDNVIKYRGGDISSFLAKHKLVSRGDLIRMAVMHKHAPKHLLDTMQNNPNMTYAGLRNTDRSGFNKVRNFVKASLTTFHESRKKPRRRVRL
ncbi:MAG TPA: hypothetical protein VJG83_06200 [archaeon]|nr:hypothetical protein [archaeon]